MWERKPADWPEHIPFLDPNNKKKSDAKGCKPTKEELFPMLLYLLHKHVG